MLPKRGALGEARSTHNYAKQHYHKNEVRECTWVDFLQELPEHRPRDSDEGLSRSLWYRHQ